MLNNNILILIKEGNYLYLTVYIKILGLIILSIIIENRE